MQTLRVLYSESDTLKACNQDFLLWHLSLSLSIHFISALSVEVFTWHLEYLQYLLSKYPTKIFFMMLLTSSHKSSKPHSKIQLSRTLLRLCVCWLKLTASERAFSLNTLLCSESSLPASPILSHLTLPNFICEKLYSGTSDKGPSEKGTTSQLMN